VKEVLLQETQQEVLNKSLLKAKPRLNFKKAAAASKQISTFDFFRTGAIRFI
jgi:hypothetical protein